MYRVEERTAEDTLSTLFSHKVSGSVRETDDVFARIRSFQSHFASLTRTPNMLRLMMQPEFNFVGVVDVTDAQSKYTKNQMLQEEWWDSTFVVVDYSRAEAWARKIHEEVQQGKSIVALLPARTAQKWFHDLVLNEATEVRFVQGQVVPNNEIQYGHKAKSMQPSCIAIYKNYVPRKDVPKGKSALTILEMNASFTSGTPDVSARHEYLSEDED
ncbi:adenine methyltransferase [Sicyoidochytrium minutum DNA virus]|nr:adenine methyltransferase [Sicyoidochytrium minutum DNA virus]BDC16948.1 DNA N-6-adenine-methyltransferase [Sicyoidochytrium minutum DNA virus]